MNIKQLNEILDVYLQEAAWKNSCGLELNKQLVNSLKQKNTNLPELKSENIDAKISWLIKYIDIVPKEELIGLKISHIGKIKYIEHGKYKEQTITLCIGDADTNNKIKPYTKQGLYHMKYGDNKHWDKSKQALHHIPKNFEKGKQLQGDTQYKYVFLYKAKSTSYTYVVGVPSEKGDATILITCL